MRIIKELLSLLTGICVVAVFVVLLVALPLQIVSLILSIFNL